MNNTRTQPAAQRKNVPLQPQLFEPFPVLHTPRLILRQPAFSDAQDLYAMRSDPEVMRYIPRPLATCIADVEALLSMMNEALGKSERINWAMEWRETGAVIGMIGFVNIKWEHRRAEVGYSLARTWHRQGIMREALQAVLRFAFSGMKMHSAEAIIDEENIPSGKLLEGTGFRREARFCEDFLHDGAYRNSVHFGMLAREFGVLNEHESRNNVSDYQ